VVSVGASYYEFNILLLVKLYYLYFDLVIYQKVKGCSTFDFSMADEIFDVVVIGGGISGLTSAYTISKRVPNLKCVVLEAKG